LQWLVGNLEPESPAMRQKLTLRLSYEVVDDRPIRPIDAHSRARPTAPLASTPVSPTDLSLIVKLGAPPTATSQRWPSFRSNP
jgi:hypothetical protein